MTVTVKSDRLVCGGSDSGIYCLVCDGSDSGNQTVECVMVVTVEIRLLSV